MFVYGGLESSALQNTIDDGSSLTKCIQAHPIALTAEAKLIFLGHNYGKKLKPLNIIFKSIEEAMKIISIYEETSRYNTKFINNFRIIRDKTTF